MRSDAGATNDRRIVAFAAILAGLAVALGAFGAHALKSRLNAQELGWWETAVEYQMWHALAVLAIGLSSLQSVRLPAVLLGTGAMIFSATLYAMALGAPHMLGAITPLGGILMIGGWVLLVVRGFWQRT